LGFREVNMKRGRTVPSRREVLAGLGALSGSTLVGSSLAGAADVTGPTALPEASTRAVRVQEVPAPTTAGMRYVNIAGMQFQPGSNAFVYTSVGGELTATSSSFYTCHLAGIPAGARLAELVAYFVKNSPNDIFFRVIRSDGSPGGNIFDAIVNVDTGAFGQSSSPQTLIQPIASSPSAIVDPANAAHFAIVNMPGVSTVRLNGIRVGYISSLTNFVPLPPGRVFDTRWPIFGATRVLGGQNFQVNVSHRRTLDGTLDLLDFVPPGASAVALSASLTETVAQGFIAITSGDAPTFSAASITWFGTNQTVTTGANSPVNLARLVKIFAGGSGGAQTHLILDVTGYYI
jgi:hypothetical protein